MTTDTLTPDASAPLARRLEVRDRQIAAVHTISGALFSVGDLDTLLRETLRVSLDAVEADAGSILLYDPDKRRLVFRYVVGATNLIGMEIDPEEDENGRAATAFRTGVSSVTATRTGSYNPTIDFRTGFHTETIVTVPIKSLGNETVGVMQALNKRSGLFDSDDKEVLEIISGLAATSITNAQLAHEAQLAAVTRAMGDLAHDIKNALTPIETTISTTVESFIEPMYEDVDRLSGAWGAQSPDAAGTLAEAMQPLRDWYPEMAAAVRDGCDDIKEMVSEIADYIKGAQATHREAGDICAVAEERLRRLKVVAQNRRVTLHMDCAPVPAFAFDHRLIGRAVYNLVNNALGAIGDAVKKGTLELRPQYNVWVSVTAEEGGEFGGGGSCRIEVRDDGPGIPPLVRESLFTPNTISTTAGGTGIGTRFVKSVADAHGGTVGVESEPGRGARFWMRLPLNTEAAR